MVDQVLRLLRKRGAGADEVVGFAGVGDEVVGLDGLREVVDGDHLPAVGAYAMGSVPLRASRPGAAAQPPASSRCHREKMPDVPAG